MRSTQTPLKGFGRKVKNSSVNRFRDQVFGRLDARAPPVNLRRHPSHGLSGL